MRNKNAMNVRSSITMTKYVKNGSFKASCEDVHGDEANPHLHIDYVLKFENSLGLKMRFGMDRVLQQGVHGKGTELIVDWRQFTMAYIKFLAKEQIPNNQIRMKIKKVVRPILIGKHEIIETKADNSIFSPKQLEVGTSQFHDESKLSSP